MTWRWQLSLAAIPVLMACHGASHGTASPASVGPGAVKGQYAVVHGWPTLPEGYMLGQATGVGVDSHGDVLVFHRAGREWKEPFPTTVIHPPTVAIFDGRTGRLKAQWGADRFVMPHGLTIDADNNLWLTDVALQQVFKFTHDGRLLLTVGEAGVAGADGRHFDRPTDVAVRGDGSFYVSDGYRNTRVVRFSPDGRFISEWGAPGSGPGQFDLPHGIALDRRGRIYVADRSNARVQVFDSVGRFLALWKSAQLGRPYAITIAGSRAYVVDGGDQPDTLPDRSRALELDLDGRIGETFGRFGNYDGQFVLAHDVAVDSNGAVYVADAWGKRVQKFARTPRR